MRKLNQPVQSDDHPEWKKGVREDLLIWVILLVLLAMTFGVSFAPWGIWSTIVSLSISAAKTALVAYFYMHLKKEKGMTRIFAFGGVAWLMILFSLTLSDYITRSWLPYPSRWPIFVDRRPAPQEEAKGISDLSHSQR